MDKTNTMSPEEIFFWSKCMNLSVSDVQKISKEQGRYILKQNKENQNVKGKVVR